MREIKFRAWHEYGDATDPKKLKPGMIYDINPGDCLKWKNEHQKITDIMQYTGLKDKAGKEIFENDIWKRGVFIAIVEFTFDHWSLEKTESSKSYEYPSFYSNAASGEIIGDIHTTPELLK